MPRSALVERLHGAWYDALTTSGEGAAMKLEEWRNLRDECCRTFDCSPDELQAALRGDFGKWIRENGLPRPAGKAVD